MRLLLLGNDLARRPGTRHLGLAVRVLVWHDCRLGREDAWRPKVGVHGDSEEERQGVQARPVLLIDGEVACVSGRQMKFIRGRENSPLTELHRSEDGTDEEYNTRKAEGVPERLPAWVVPDLWVFAPDVSCFHKRTGNYSHTPPEDEVEQSEQGKADELESKTDKEDPGANDVHRVGRRHAAASCLDAEGDDWCKNALRWLSIGRIQQPGPPDITYYRR